MKAIKFLSMMLAMTLALGFTSCSSDDDDETVDSPIVGSWSTKNSYGTTITLIFNNDLTGRVNYVYPDDEGGSYETFEYYYDEQSKKLGIIGETQFAGIYTVTLTATYLQLVLEDGDYYQFKKS